jgi:poly-beta-1,6-N-acetyl-D-glucosamine synthase
MVSLESLFYLLNGLIVYSYLIYPIGMWMYSSIKDNTAKSFGIDEGDYFPSVSLIISAYNEEPVIKKKLENCLAIDYPIEQLEIIIASDGSDDQTNDIIREYDSDRIKFYDLERMGKVNVLNTVIPKSHGDILVFSDANTIYNTNAIKELAKYFNNDAIGCVCGNLQLINPDTNEVDGESLYWRYEKWIKKSESKLGVVVGANGAIYAIRRSILAPLPGNTINDDFHNSMQTFVNKSKLIFAEEAVAKEDVAVDFQSEFKRHIRDGAGHYREMWHFASLLNPFKGKYFFAYFSHRVLRWLVPFFMIAIFILNLLLIDKLFFAYLLKLQLTFYASVFILFILKRNGINVGILNVILFFTSTNIALFIGFLKNILGLQSVKWDSTKRI